MADWSKILSRGNVEDRRGLAPAVGGISLTGVALLVLFNVLTGGDITDVLTQINSIPMPVTQELNAEQFEGQDSYEVFASTVLGSSDEVWSSVFADNNREYNEPRLVLFRSATNSACGTATSAVGPHYCPLDTTIYLDETFFDELTTRLGAQGGDVAEAYVIAHEVGHHVQNELGVLNRVQTQQQALPAQANELSVQLELQADCLAGVWANSIRELGIFEPGEIREAMDAAAAAGDDRIQERVQGYINPERWTHGSAEQRMTWFNRGYETGDIEVCNATR
jgi:predicted metalloprotease